MFLFIETMTLKQMRQLFNLTTHLFVSEFLFFSIKHFQQVCMAKQQEGQL